MSISFSGIAYAAYTVVDADDIDADNGAIQITPRNEEGYLFNANGNASNITQTGGFYSVLKTQNVFNQNDTIKIFIKNDSTGFSVSDGGKVFMGAWDEDNLNNAKIHNLQLENQTGGKTINWTFEANYDHEDDAGASDNGDNGDNSYEGDDTVNNNGGYDARLAYLNYKREVLELPAEEETSIEINEGREKGRLCIVSDNAKTNNPCMAITY